MSFRFEPQAELPEVVLIHTDIYTDDRGYFFETYKHSAFAAAGISERFVQENSSHSTKNVLRGLHYQKDPTAQGKLVRCVRGTIFDVAVDIREGSPTRGVWTSAILSADNRDQLYIPPGYAHGFCVISDEADVAYLCTEEYSKADEKGIVWNDPTIGIVWPLSGSPILSEKDAQYAPLD